MALTSGTRLGSYEIGDPLGRGGMGEVFTGPAETLFESAYWYGAGGPDGFGGRSWDLDPTGERFLMIGMPLSADGDETGGSNTLRINVVLNRDQELLQRVPVD